MTDQVTSIEQSKRLIDLGVPAEKASMIYQSHFTQGVPKLYAQPYQRNGYPPKEKIREDVVPAFTVADLLGLFKSITFTTWELNPNLEKTRDGGWDFEFGEITGEEDYGFARNKSLVDLLVGRIEWLLSNGYKLNI